MPARKIKNDLWQCACRCVRFFTNCSVAHGLALMGRHLDNPVNRRSVQRDRDWSFIDDALGVARRSGHLSGGIHRGTIWSSRIARPRRCRSSPRSIPSRRGHLDQQEQAGDRQRGFAICAVSRPISAWIAEACSMWVNRPRLVAASRDGSERSSPRCARGGRLRTCTHRHGEDKRQRRRCVDGSHLHGRGQTRGPWIRSRTVSRCADS